MALELLLYDCISLQQIRNFSLPLWQDCFVAFFCETISFQRVLLQTTIVHESLSAISARISLFHRMIYSVLSHVFLRCELALAEITFNRLVFKSLVRPAHFFGLVKFQLVNETCDETTISIALEETFRCVVMAFAQFVSSFEHLATASTRISCHWASILIFELRVDPCLGVGVFLLRVMPQMLSLGENHGALVTHVAPDIAVDCLVMAE